MKHAAMHAPNSSKSYLWTPEILLASLSDVQLEWLSFAPSPSNAIALVCCTPLNVISTYSTTARCQYRLLYLPTH